MMDSLSPQEAEKVHKMSSDRIRSKLVQHLNLLEIEESEIANLPRESLLQAMAELTLRLKETLPSSRRFDDLYDESELGQMGPTMESQPDRDDVKTDKLSTEIHLIQLKLEMQREEHEFALRQQQMIQAQELEMAKIASSERVKLAQLESEARKPVLSAPKCKDKDDPAVILKRYADCVKSVMPKQPTDSAGLPLWFSQVERIFLQYKIPCDLKASLLLPHLNEKTQTMAVRLPPDDMSNYERLKQFILSQHKIGWRQHRSRFEQCKKRPI